QDASYGRIDRLVGLAVEQPDEIAIALVKALLRRGAVLVDRRLTAHEGQAIRMDHSRATIEARAPDEEISKPAEPGSIWFTSNRVRVSGCAQRSMHRVSADQRLESDLADLQPTGPL